MTSIFGGPKTLDAVVTASTDDFPSNFFAALNRNDDDKAVAHLKASAFVDGTTPSPRAQKLVESGEWDIDQRLGLVYIDESSCMGRIGTEGSRFCGKRKTECKASSHEKVVVQNQARGWYVATASKASGVFPEYHLPAKEDGGPIGPGGAGRLMDGENPFKLNKGQWEYVIQEYHARNVVPPDSWDDDMSEVFDTKLPAIQTTTTTTAEEVTVTGVQQPSSASTYFEAFPELQATNQAEQQPNNQATQQSYVSLGVYRDDLASLRYDLQQVTTELARVGQEGKTRESMFIHQTRSLEVQHASMRTEFRQLEALFQNLTRQHQAAEATFANAIQSVHNRIDLVPEGGNTSGGLSAAQITLLKNMEHRVMSPHGEFSTLRSQFTMFRDKLESGGGIECHGVSFNSKKDLLNWFSDKNLSIEIFIDGLAFLHAIRASAVQIDEAGKQRELEIKNKATSTLQMAVMTSFDTIIPSVFIAGKRTTDGGGGTYAWLIANLKKFEVWKPLGMSNGVSHQIMDGIPKVSARVVELRRLQTEDNQAVTLSSGLCHDSATFCNELVRFITEQYEELTQRTLYPPEQIWSLQMECLQKIIEELSEAREAVSDAARFQPGYYLWGMLRAWKVQKRYMENHFKNDPALSGIMVRRILLQGQDASLKAELLKVAGLEKAFLEFQRKEEEHHRNQLGELKKLKDSVAAVAARNK